MKVRDIRAAKAGRPQHAMKTLLLDIESAPNTVFAWGLWQQNIAISQVIQTSEVLCWSAKWLGSDENIFMSVNDGKRKMLRGIHKLLDKADAVIHYNGKRFDIPVLNREFFLAKMRPPSPYKQIDLLQAVKRNFRFASNKLDFVAQQIGVGRKADHEGFKLWVRCMDGNASAWRRMERYNRKDVDLLEKVYKRMLGWIDNHPNVTMYGGPRKACTHCGSANIQQRGYLHLVSGTRKRYACMSCGAWSSELITNRAVPMRSAA